MGRGGERWGAGRPAQKVKAEQLQRLDIRQLHQRGLLDVGTYSAWCWTRNGEPAGRVAFTVYENSIWLDYRANGRDTAQTIETTETPCAYGGSRRWFACPVCGGRCAVLFMRASRFACRSCQRVSYSTQSGSKHNRLNMRYHRLLALVEAGKPKWQRWATFNKLERQLDRADELATNSLMMFVKRLTGEQVFFD